MAGLARKINGEWDFGSIEGERTSGIVCHICGEIVKLTYQKSMYSERYGQANYCLCPNCFDGDKEIALICKMG